MLRLVFLSSSLSGYSEHGGAKKMRSKSQFELWRWFYYVILFLIGTAIGITIIEIIAAPLIAWLLHDIPYHLPPWNRAMRWVIGIPIFAAFAGTVAWYTEKRSNGR